MLIRPLPLLNFFVAVVMFSIGLRVTGGDLLNIVRGRALLTRTLLANCVLIPAIGFLLVHVFPLSPEARVGILLLAAIPGAPMALQFTRKAETKLAFAGAMTFVLSAVSVAITPLAVQIMPETKQPDALPVLLLVANVAFYIALPLAAGVWLTRHAPTLAHRLVLPLGVLASIIFVFLMWETRLIRAEAFRAIRGGGSVAAMCLLLLLSMVIGWLIGGPGRESRRILATASGMRGVIVTLYVARYCFPGTNVHMVPLVYLSLMVPTNLVFNLALTQWNKRRPPEQT